MNFSKQKIKRLMRFVESVLGDWYLNIHTRGPSFLGQERGQNQDAVDYDTIAHCAIEKAIRLVQLTPEDVVFDLGCGKGRAVCHFAQRWVQKVVGIEISEQLCRVARTNARRLRNRRSPVEIINADAAIADISDGTVYYLFNPFGEKTLQNVLTNIETSHDLTVAKVKIIYMNAVLTDVFDEFPYYSIAYDYRRASGHRVIIYHNRALGIGHA